MPEEEAFLLFIVRALVNSPQEVDVVRTTDEKGILLTLTVSPDDLGRLIGKSGQHAQSIRTLLRALGNRSGTQCSLKINDFTNKPTPVYAGTMGEL